MAALASTLLRGAAATWGEGRYSVTCVNGILKIRFNERDVDPAHFTKRAVATVRKELKREIKLAQQKSNI